MKGKEVFMWQRASQGGGSGGMTLTKYTAISSNTEYSIDMQNGVYYTQRTDSSPSSCYIKGYIENGQHTSLAAVSGATVTYSGGTLKVKKGTGITAPTDLYFFKFD